MSELRSPSDRAYKAAWYAAHREEQRASHAAYYAAHREEQATRTAAWSAAHPDEQAACTAAWSAAHPERRREHARRGNAKRRGARLCEHASCLALGASRLAWQTNEHVCYLCRVHVAERANLRMDHVVPIINDGLHCAENLRPACADCNLSKGARLLEENHGDSSRGDGSPFVPRAAAERLAAGV